MPNATDAIVLFSGGLDSILAARLLQKQGLHVHCIHFYSPFFGRADLIPDWEKTYDLRITAQDIGPDFSRMLALYPPHGVGSALNPCVDCKIMQIRFAKAFMEEKGAAFIATGEVLGQRPMSQRSESLNVIAREAGVTGLLLRPLSALALTPTPMEESGLVDRSQLMGISGRGRVEQLRLAAEMNIRKIPAPAGGCLLTEKENTRRYWPLLKPFWLNPSLVPENGRDLAASFYGAATGRQFLRENRYWLRVGRNAADNEKLRATAGSGDLFLKLAGMPGPLGVARAGDTWEDDILREACGLLAAHSPRAVKSGAPVFARVFGQNRESVFQVSPLMDFSAWAIPAWEETREEIRREMKARNSARTGGNQKGLAASPASGK